MLPFVLLDTCHPIFSNLCMGKLMRIYILVLDHSTLGGIEKVAGNLKCMFSDGMSFSSVEIVDISVLNNKYGNNLTSKSQFSLLSQFICDLADGDIVLSLYDRISIQLAVLRKRYKGTFKLVACQHADYFANRLYTRILRLVTYKFVDYVVALTDTDKSLYEKDGFRVKKIPNPIRFYPEKVQPFELRNNTVIAAGRLNKVKRFDHFVNVVASCKDIPNYKFEIWGDGEERQNLERYITSLDLNSMCELMGVSNDFDAILGTTKFIVVTSLRESFSMVILEAMASGCIPISYDCPTGPRELIKDRSNGYLVPDGDYMKIGEIICHLISNPDEAKFLAENARAFSLQYSFKHIKSQWQDIIDELF